MGKPKGTKCQQGGDPLWSPFQAPISPVFPVPVLFALSLPDPRQPAVLPQPGCAPQPAHPSPGLWRLEAGAGGWRPQLGTGLRGRCELVTVLSCCWSEGGQVTDLPAGVTQETHNYMLVTAMLHHLNHAAAMSEMLSLGIKENKQAEAALAAAVALSSDCPAPPGAVALPARAGPAVGRV